MARTNLQDGALQQTETKNPRWYIRYRRAVLTDDGIERLEAKEYFGYVRDVGPREAARRRTEFLRKINSPQEEIPSQIKFGRVLSEYLKGVSVRDTSLLSYSSVVNKWIRPRWGDTRICDIRQKDLEPWLMEVSRGLSDKRYDKIKTVFSETWKTALRYEYTERQNPIAILPKNFGRPKVSARLKMPTRAEMESLVAAMAEPWRLAGTIMMWTGLRVSECLGLRWCDFEANSFLVTWTCDQRGNRTAVTKSDLSQRPTPIGHLHHIVRRPAGARPEDFIFPASYKNVNREFGRAAEAVGIAQHGMNCHMFRRWFNTAFRRESKRLHGVDKSVEMAMAQMGHANAATNELYMFEGEPEILARAEVAAKLMGKERVN